MKRSRNSYFLFTLFNKTILKKNSLHLHVQNYFLILVNTAIFFLIFETATSLFVSFPEQVKQKWSVERFPQEYAVKRKETKGVNKKRWGTRIKPVEN